MRLYEYIKNGGAFWDNTLSYPESITATVRENVTNTIKYRFSFHKLRKTLEGMASDYNVELSTLIPSIIYNVMITNDYKYNTLYATLNLEYNPIENYRMTETETIDRDITTSDSGTTSGTRGNTTTNNLTDTETLNLSDAETLNLSDAETLNLSDEETVNLENKLTLNTENTTTPNIQDTTTDVKTTNNETTVDNTGITDVETRKGFNSNEWEGDTKHEVDSSETSTADITENDTLTYRHTGTESVAARGTETTANTGTDTTLRTGTDTTLRTGTDTTLRTGTDTTTHTGTVQDSESTSGTHSNSGSEAEDVDRTLTRAGNIGVTTSQQMLESERQVALFSFIDIVTADIIKEICINVV